MKIHNPYDFSSGLALMLTGAGFALGSMQYPFGRSAQPGPGYFPLLLSLLLLLLGSVIFVKSVIVPYKAPDDLGPIAWRPLIVVMAAIGLFGFLLPRAGLVITFPTVVLVTGMASRDFRWRSSLAYAGMLTALAWLIFVVLLRLPLPVWPVGF